MGVSSRKGTVKAVVMTPSTVALLVRSKIQIDRANSTMVEARIESACPESTMPSPSSPPGDLPAGLWLIACIAVIAWLAVD